jgi:hypothetical protein
VWRATLLQMVEEIMVSKPLVGTQDSNNKKTLIVCDRISDPTGNFPQRVGIRCWRRATARMALGRRRDSGARERERMTARVGNLPAPSGKPETIDMFLPD